jgi:hypothetical protein
MAEMYWFIKKAASDDALDERFTSQAFLNAVYDAVLELHDQTRALPANSRMLLTLLTYCYARGVYSAEAIEAAAQEDSVVRYICARDFPTAAEIRDFRRSRKDLVVQALAKALENDSFFRPRFFSARQESERRVAKAIQWDSFEMDL